MHSNNLKTWVVLLSFSFFLFNNLPNVAAVFSHYQTIDLSTTALSGNVTTDYVATIQIPSST